MVFASLILMVAYFVFLCVSFTLGVIVPFISLVLAVICLIASVILWIAWARQKKNARTDEQLLCEEGGYWKVIGRKAVRTGTVVLLVMSILCFVVCAGIAALFYL